MLTGLKTRIKNSHHPIAGYLFSLGKWFHRVESPVLQPFHFALYTLHRTVSELADYVLRIGYWTPLFKSQLMNHPKQLYLYSGMPLLIGPLNITMGDHCRVSGHTTFCGRGASVPTPTLIIGNNVGISWQNEILVGTRVVIGDNVRLAVKVRLVGYPGHPVNAEDRAEGKPDTPDQIGDIILEDNVWLGAGVSVMSGVTIGAGTIVATGSVVTQDLPPGVLAGGMPAKIIKSLSASKATNEDNNHG